jgi:hypothetical protein
MHYTVHKKFFNWTEPSCRMKLQIVINPAINENAYNKFPF